MAGRNDFAIIRSEALGNEHVCELADALVAAELVTEQAAISAALGVVAQLGLWAYRETDDGILTRRGVSRALASTGRLLDVCWTSSVLRTIDDRTKAVRGFDDCYGDYVRRRKRDAERKRVARRTRKSGRPSDVPKTSAGCPGVQDRTESPLTPHGGDLFASLGDSVQVVRKLARHFQRDEQHPQHHAAAGWLRVCKSIDDGTALNPEAKRGKCREYAERMAAEFPDDVAAMIRRHRRGQ